MIVLPSESQQKLTSEMKQLIEFFNRLEQRLRYPVCEGNADQVRTLAQAEQELIMWGKI